MSIWSTFISIKTHGEDHSEATPGQCGCSDSNEIHLSSAWFGFPFRLSMDSDGEHAAVCLTRGQARRLAAELELWARRDEIGEIRMRREWMNLPGFTVRWGSRDGATGTTETDMVEFACSCGTSFQGTSARVLEHLHAHHPEWTAA